MTIGDTDIPAGLYTLFMIDAQQEAINKINEADSTDSEDATEASSETTEATEAPDYYSLKVENKDFSEWVQEKAVESCKKYVAVNNLFTELSLTLTVDDQQVLESSVTSTDSSRTPFSTHTTARAAPARCRKTISSPASLKISLP